jgi:hypothetical protein
MAFVIDAARPEDLAELTSVIFRSHEGKDHYVNCAYPDNLSPEGQSQALKKLQTIASAAEDSLWLKATDPTTGKIVGAAIWTTFITRKPLATDSSKKNDEQGSRNEEYVKQLNASIMQAGAEFWKNNALPLTSLFFPFTILKEFSETDIRCLRSFSTCGSSRVSTKRDRHTSYEVRV